LLHLHFNLSSSRLRRIDHISSRRACQIIEMPSLFPSQDVARESFRSPLTLQPKPTPYQARPELYGAWSVIDDAKNKAQKLSKEAQAEFDKASSAARGNTGKIELYSGKYYAACTVGGLLACVCEKCVTRRRY
jgi:hypothetical protein